MGYNELVAHLHKEGENKVQLMRKQIEAEADKTRADIAKRIEQVRGKYRERQKRAVKEQEDDILLEAEKMARTLRLSAEKSLSDRLFPLSLLHLHELRNESYTDVFASLVKELPPFPWKEVRVNPADVKTAQEYFPEAQIIPDKNITGGLTVLTEDRKIRGVNTFEKRLERAWEDLSPLLIREVYKEVSGYGTPSDS